MTQISEQELLDKPDLASAVDGWEQACLGVQAQALARWRRARREACFWYALCRTPPPDVLLSSVCLEKHAGWLRVPSAPPKAQDIAPSARLVAPRAQAAPTDSRAPPQQPGGLPWPY